MMHFELKVGLFIFLIAFSSFFMITFTLFNPLNNQEKNLPLDNSGDLKASAHDWIANILISTSTTDDAEYPAIAVDWEGAVHIVWQDNSQYYDSDTAFDIIYKRWDPIISTFTTWTLVSTISTSTASNPDIAVDCEGNAHVVWMDYTNVLGAGSNADIFYRMWNKSTNSWQGRTGTYDLVTYGLSANCQYPKIAVDSMGNIHVVWMDYNNNASYGDTDTYVDVYYKCWNATTRMWDATPQLVSTESTSYAEYPDVAVDAQGNVHVTWEDSTSYGHVDSYDDIFYKYRNVTTGSWTVTEVISAQSTSYAYRPSIAVDGLGNVHIAWYDLTNIYGAGTDYDIFYRMWNSTTHVWSGHVNTTDVVSRTPYSSYHPAVGADEFGNVNIVWQQLDSYSDEAIHYRMWNANTKSWEPTESLCPTSWRTIDYPAIAVHPLGDSHVVWHYDNYDYEVRYRKSTVSPPVPPPLQPITPNPNPNLDNQLTWSGWLGATHYYVYRSTSFINSVVGLTPVVVVSSSSCADVVTENGTYYYVVMSATAIGNSSISNCESINVSAISGFHRVRITKNADFVVFADSGNGSAINPWIIKDWFIDGMGSDGIHISNTTDHFILQDNTVFGCSNGIYLENVINGQIKNNTAKFNKIGFKLKDSSGNILINNTSYNNSHPSDSAFGFALFNSNNNWFEDNHAYNNNGALNLGGVGFYLSGSSSNNLIENSIYSNMGAGIYFIQYSNFNNVTRTQIFSNRGNQGYDDNGIVFESYDNEYNRLVENNIYDHLDAGIQSGHAGPNYVINNSLHHNKYGIYTVNSVQYLWEISYNKFFNNEYAGNLWMALATFYKNEIWNNTNGLYFVGVGGSTLINNTAWNNTNYGFSTSAYNMRFYNNTAYKNGAGFGVGGAGRIIMEDNFAINNTNYGFWIGAALDQFANNFVSGSNYGFYLSGSENISLSSNTIRNTNTGIYLLNTKFITIYSNEISKGGQYGIYSENSNHTAITWNTIGYFTQGIRLLKDINTTIKYNEIYNNTQYGIGVEKTNQSKIIWNQVVDNGIAIRILSGVNNTITNNAVVRGPHLQAFPATVSDGRVYLSWETLAWATSYDICRRKNMGIRYWDLLYLTPINQTNLDQYTDFPATLGIYYKSDRD